MAASSMQMTMKRLKETDRRAGIVERFVHNRIVQAQLEKRAKTGHKEDLFNLFDILCMDGNHITGIQTCCADRAAHYRKITEEKAQDALLWLASGGKIELWTWRKVKKVRGGKQMIWQPLIEEIGWDDFPESLADAG